MRECSYCGACYEDRVSICPNEGESTRTTLSGTVILDSKYLLNRRLGQGGMGIVYEATQIILQRNVAIKVLTPEYFNNQSKERFQREALAIARLKHPNIVSIYDLGFSEDGYAYLVMDFIAGFPLRLLLDRYSRCGLEFGIDICRQICEAIAMAHLHGVLHRDLKPENIMFEGLLNECVMKVVDFGLAKLIDDHEHLRKLTSPNMIVGTYNYMSPEQCRSAQIDERSDIYGLGILFYEMFVGRVPFLGSDPLEVMDFHLGRTPDPPSNFVSEMPPKLEDLIMSALEKEPEKRPQRAIEMAKELSQLLIEISNQNNSQSIATKAELLKAQNQMRFESELPQISRELQRCQNGLLHNAKDINLHHRLAELYQESGRVDNAIDTYINSAVLQVELNRPELAVYDYLKVRNLVDYDRREMIANRLSTIYLSTGRYDQAYKQIRFVINYLISKKNFAEATKYLNELPPLGTNDANYRGQLEKLITDGKVSTNSKRLGWRRRNQGQIQSNLSDQLVLIVDPDPIRCYQLARAIRRMGARVEMTSTAEKTLEIIKHRWPTLMIFEMVLPDMSGSELFYKLTNSGLAHETIFICVSSNRDDTEIDAAFTQGIDEYWTKPLNLVQVSTRVKRLLLHGRFRTQLIGRLSKHPLIEVIEKLEWTRRTGMLAIKSGAERARIFFDKGLIVNAELGQFTPLTAIYRMLAWDEGRFHFRPEPATENQPLHLSRRELKLAALNIYDEECRLITQFPSQTACLKLSLPEMILPDEREQEILNYFDGSRPLAEIFELLRGDFNALRTALALYRTNRESTYISDAQTVISNEANINNNPTKISDSRIYTRRLNEATLKKLKLNNS